MSWFNLQLKKLREFKNLETLLLVISLVLYLFPVLTNKYFVTGDGPCHLYNSRVFLDFITGTNVDFYSDYYTLNQNFEPNWFSHIILAGLLTIFPGYLAEKVFITSYIVLFAFSFRFLIRQINKDNTFIVLLGLPFMYTHTLQMGFFNYSFSFIFYFFTVGYWLKHHDNFTLLKLAKFSALNLLLYFSHPIGWLLSLLTIGILIITDFTLEYFRNKNQSAKAFKNSLKSAFQLFVAFLPAIILFIQYLFRKGLNPTPNPDSFSYLVSEFFDLTSVIAYVVEEKAWTIRFAYLIGFILLYGIYTKVKSRDFNAKDAFFIVSIIMLIGYFNQPGGMAGAGILSIRLQFIPYLVMVIWFANLRFSSVAKYTILMTSFIIGITLLVIRYPHQVLASNAAVEYISVQDYIEENSTVLPLSYSHNGKTPDGELVANKIWLFMHGSDYLGADKSLILFGNYEGNTGFFPIIWKPERNPFVFIGTNEGVEHQPPSVDILNYHKKTGGEIDYVITWCLDDQYLTHDYTQNTLSQLAENYTLIYTSENSLAKLYKRKD